MGCNLAILQSCFIGIALPVYSTFKAIERKDQNEQQMMLLYWAAYGSFSIVEVFFDKLISCGVDQLVEIIKSFLMAICANVMATFSTGIDSQSFQVPISRSAVNHESGAKTGLSGIVTGIIMNCALLFLTPLFEYIPQAGMFPL